MSWHQVKLDKRVDLYEPDRRVQVPVLFQDAFTDGNCTTALAWATLERRDDKLFAEVEWLPRGDAWLRDRGAGIVGKPELFAAYLVAEAGLQRVLFLFVLP